MPNVSPPHLVGAVAALVGCSMIIAPASAQIQYQEQTTTRFPQPNLNEYTNQASIVDVDNDGDLDIALANGQGFSAQGATLRARLFINDGTGVFTEESTARLQSWTGWARGVEFGDCDRDGDWDMVIAQDFNKQPQLFINNGAGTFTNQTTTRLPVQMLSSARAQFGDVDNDGDLDLVFCHSGPTNRFGTTGQPQLFLNDGTGVYTNGTAARFPSGAVPDQQDIIFGDIDGDLDLDIHLTSRASASKLWINDGTGVFVALAGFPGGSNAYSYDFGDINGDGDLDLIGVNGVAEILLRNNAPATAWANISTEISPNSAIDDNDSKFFDLDNDGDLDFIVGSLGSVERIYRNNGTVAGADFTQVLNMITANSDSTMDIEVADLTGDGKLDIVTLQGESGSFIDRIYVNIGVASVIDNRAPKIINTDDLPDTNTPGPFVVRTVVYDDYSSDRGFFDKGVFLNYSVDAGPVQQVPMLWSGNSLWRGELPKLPEGTIDYYVTATDWNNNVGTGTTHSFVIDIATCPAANLNGDGAVDVLDMLAVIGAWGPCVDPKDCPADIAPEGGDDNVDVLDLLAVIGGWGPCSSP